ncbi:MAG: hypothetical protein ACOC53_07990 [Candidatus Saliniplasma sp.]
MNNVSSDVKLEKAVQLVIEDLRCKMGKDAEDCYIFEYMNDFYLELIEENNANLKKEIPLPDLNIGCKRDCKYRYRNTQKD